jgi:hypothetical protein
MAAGHSFAFDTHVDRLIAFFERTMDRFQRSASAHPRSR